MKLTFLYLFQQNVQYNPLFNGGAGYFVPTMPQAQRGFFAPANMTSIRQTRAPWGASIRPNQAATGELSKCLPVIEKTVGLSRPVKIQDCTVCECVDFSMSPIHQNTIKCVLKS